MYGTNLAGFLVRILRDDRKPREPAGAGILVSHRHILTCAHVVSNALGISEHLADPPAHLVFCDFPLIEHQPVVVSKVLGWNACCETPVIGQPEDIAVLELLADESAPRHARPAPVVTVQDFTDREVRMCGFPRGMDNGDHVNGKTRGLTGSGGVLFDPELGSRSVAPGFSGTAVWDRAEGAVIGMVNSSMVRDGITAGCMIPASTLIQAFPGLRRLSRPPNPYKGLHAFSERDAPHFFGREAMVGSLHETIERQHFVVLIGASGSGKSSVVFGGLVPGLRSAGEWLTADMRPKGEPFHRLASALIPFLYKDKLEQAEKLVPLAEKLDSGAMLLSSVLRLIARENPDGRLLLTVDQFEELFSQNPDKDLQRRFIERLLEPLSAPLLPFRLLLTMRADFMSQAVAFGAFAEALDRDPPRILTGMNGQELTMAIEEPASRLGVRIEPGLTHRILNDVGSEPGQLPLLEFALTLLWEQQLGGTLTHAAYDAIGGVQKALARHADSVLEELKGKEELVRKVFIQLVRPGEGTEDTRQVAFRAQFQDDRWNLVSVLADHRLVVTGSEEESGQETVEVVHEALIRHWQPLRQWMAEDRSFRVWQEGLKASMKHWEQGGRDVGDLLRGHRLFEALGELRERGDELGRAEVHFIGLALEHHRKEAEAREKERKDKERLRRRLWTAVTCGLLIIVLGTLAWLKSEQGQTEILNETLSEVRQNQGFVFHERTMKAFRERAWNEVRLFAHHAMANFDPQRWIPEKAELTGLLLSSPCYRIGFSIGDPVEEASPPTVVFSPDSKTLAYAASGGTIGLWDLGTGNERVLKGETHFTPVVFSPDGETLASISPDRTILLWDVRTGNERAVLKARDAAPPGGRHPVIDRFGAGLSRSVAFSPDGRKLALISRDRTIRLWDLTTVKEMAVLRGHADAVTSAAVSPDGTKLASSSRDKSIRLWDLNSGEELAVLGAHAGIVTCAAFSPDGGMLASASLDKTIRLWHLNSGEELVALRGHTEDVITDIVFSRDGKTLLLSSELGLWTGGTIRVRAVDTGSERAVLRSAGTSLFRCFSPEGGTLAYHADDGRIHLWDLNTEKELAVIKSPPEDIKHCTLSPDGKTLATTGDGRTIRLWDAGTGIERARLARNTHEFPHVAFSADGGTLASAFPDRRIELWDLRDGSKRAVALESHPSVFTSVAISADGSTLASASLDRVIRLWDLSSGKVRVEIEGHAEPVTGMAFSRDGKTLASTSKSSAIRLWDVGTGAELAVLNGHTKAINSVAFSPDGGMVASASDDQTVRLWDLATGAEPAVLMGHTYGVTSVSFSPDGRTLASASRDRTIRLWDPATGNAPAVLKGHTESVTSVSFSPDGKTLASASWDRTIRLWDLINWTDLAVLRGHAGGITSVLFSPDGKTLASASRDRVILLWDLSAANENERTVLQAHANRVTSAAFSRDGKTLATASWDKTIRLWDLETGNERGVLEGHAEGIADVVFSPDGKTLASASWDKTIRLWDLETGSERGVLEGHAEGIAGVAFSRDGKTLASASWDRTIRLWDLSAGKERAVLEGHGEAVTGVAFSPDGKTLASASWDQTIRLWDLSTGKERAALKGHTYGVYKVVYSPDGKMLASGSKDRTIRLWDSDSGEERVVLVGHSDDVVGAAFLPDGNTLASASYLDETIRLWDLSTGTELAVLKGLIGEVTSIALSPDGRTLASTSGDGWVQLCDLSPLFDARSLHEKTYIAENELYLTLNRMELQPRIPWSPPHLSPSWPPGHPLHWALKAEQGDTDAMVRLGIIHDRDGETEKAGLWYAKAARGGNLHGKERLDLLESRLKRTVRPASN